MGIRGGHLTATPIASANWATGIAYAVNDLVVNSSDIYICLTAHTSGTFVTDLAANRWQKVNKVLSGINYILNPTPTTDTNGWNTYKDADQALPENGTGGTSSLTWTRTTSSPLRGTASFLLTKSGSISERGEGVSTDFTIARSDRAKVLQIEFDYEVLTGIYATGDIACWIYDTVNNTLIQPSGYLLEAVGTGTVAKARLTFQSASNSENYRLLLHTASSTTQNFSIEFDSFIVSPQVVPMGAPVTDWVAYTPTVTAISGTLTNFTVAGFWRRNGDTADYKIRLIFNTSVVGTWSNPLFSLPSGQVVDNTKIPGGNIETFQSQTLGTATDAGTQTFALSARPYTSTTVIAQQFFVTGSVINLNSLSQASPFTWTTNDEIEFEIRQVPIVGWSSSTVVSSSADTRVVAFHADKISGAQSSSGAYQDVTSWSTATVDTHGGFNATTGVYTIKVPGRYAVSASVGFTASSGGNIRAIDVRHNSTPIIQDDALPSAVSVSQCGNTVIINAVTNDTIKLTVFQNTGGSLNYTTAQGVTTFSVNLIQGPSQIAASEVIAARYTTATAGSYGTSGAILDYTTRVFDTHSAVTTGASWRFTAPAQGIYVVSSGLSPGGTNGLYAEVYKNAVAYARICQVRSGSGAPEINGSTSVQLNAGEYINVVIFSETATTTLATSGALNYIDVHRLGGIG